MLNKIIIGLCVILPLVAFAAKPIVTEDLEISPVNLPVNQQIEYFSDLYGADVSLIKAVIRCESGYNHNTSSDNGYSNGIMQYQKSTFIRHSKLFGEELDYKSQYDQIKLGVWAMSKPELAREWTTWMAIQKGGTYSFYSRQLGKSFVVKCKL